MFELYNEYEQDEYEDIAEAEARRGPGLFERSLNHYLYRLYLSRLVTQRLVPLYLVLSPILFSYRCSWGSSHSHS